MWFRILSLLLCPSAIAAGQQTAPLNTKTGAAEKTTEPASADSFRPVTQEHLNLIKKQRVSDSSDSSVRRLSVSATLVDSDSLSGHLNLTLVDSGMDNVASSPISLGVTNLQNLQLFSDGQPVNFAHDKAGNLIPLSRPGSRTIAGSWTNRGVRVGTSTIFQLEFPPAAICDLELKTDAGILVTSPDALVFAEQTAVDFTSWKILPNNSSRFTISCDERSTTQPSEAFGVSVEADIRIEPHQTLLTWAVTTPASFSSQSIDFQFSEACTVTDVVFPETIDGTWSSNSTKQTISMDLPASADRNVLQISAVVLNHDIDKLDLPFLSPLTWKSPQSETRTPVSTQSKSLRVLIPPALLLTHVDLDGVYEGDVAHSTDGTQTLNLVQFTTTPKARFFLTRSQPVIHDATVIVLDPKTQPGKATAYVSVEAKTGSLGETEWTIPASWRVTEVKEVNTGFPLLFRVRSSDTDSDSTVLHTYLRTPVVASTGQTLQVTLQSTTTEFSPHTEPPALGSQVYHRHFDFLATHDGGTRIGLPSGITGAALMELAPWLPANTFEDAQIYERSSGGVKPDDRAAVGEEMFATIDYAPTRNGNTVRESVRLRLRRRGGIPSRIPISVTPGINISISDDSLIHPGPLLRRKGTASANWLLQFPSESDPPEELDVLLIANRRIQSSMPALVVAVDGAQQSGGSIQPPSVQEGLSLQIAESDPAIHKTISYPATPPWEMKLIQIKRDRSAQRLSGSVFRILTRNNADEIEIETAIRLQVDSADTDSSLKLMLSDARELSTFVNGRRSFADVSEGLLTIPLDRKSVTNVVDLHFQSATNSKISEPLVLPPVNCPDSDSRRIVSFTMFPSETAVVGIKTDEQTEIHEPKNTDVLLTSVFGERNRATVSPHMTPFVARWNTCASQSGSILSTAPSQRRREIRISLRDTRFDFARTILCGIGFVFLWRWLSRKLWAPGFCMLIAALIAIVLPGTISPWLNGFMGGTGCYVLMQTCSQIPVRRRRQQQSSGLPRVSTAAIICGVLTLWANSTSAEQVSTTTGSNKVQRFPEIETQTAPEEALVVTADITVHFESPQSIRAEIRCVVATQTDQIARLNLPLRNVTLTGCTLDGRKVLPTRDSTNRTQIVIPNEAVVPPKKLHDATTASGSIGPSALDGWILRHVSYTVRTVPRGSKGLYRIVVPYPPSPEMKFQLLDPTQQVLTAGIADRPRIDSEANNRWEFPALFSRNSVQLSCQLRATSDKEAATQNSVVNCSVEVSPEAVKLATTYIVKPATEDSDRVRVETDARYRINSVVSVAGDILQWSSNAGGIVVQLSPNAQGIQHFVITQSAEMPLNLTQSVHLDRIRNINAQPADTLRLSVSTTERFAVESVTLQSHDAESTNASEKTRGNPGLLKTQTDIDISPEISSAVVRLVQRKSNWEAYLQQSAVVQEDIIRWNCRCKMDVSGRPVYRQRIRIPDSVRISNVTASSNGVSRLQSWTRTGDSVIVALREPTRGVVELKFEGRISRSGNSDTMLPAISLPDAQTLESGLELSAEPQTDAYIRSLGSAIPHVAIDIDKEIIPTKPIRLSVLDEPEQVIIKARPDQKLSAEVAVLIYDSGGQPLLAQFIVLRTVEATFDVRFRLQNDGYPDVNPIAIRDDKELKLVSEGNEYLISRADRNERLLPTVLVIPDLIPPDGQRILSVSLPNFEAEIEIKSHSLFDLRSEVAARTSDVLPGWLSGAITESNITEETAALKLTDYQFSGSTNRFQIASFQQVRTESINPKRVVSAIGIHVLRPVHETMVVGESSLLTFSNDVDSVIRLALPPEIIATEVRVNGQPQTITTSLATPEVPGVEKINHVSITWTASNTFTTENFSFGFPGIVDINADASVIIVPPTPKPFFWSVGGPTLSEQDFGRRIGLGLKRAVRTVNPAFRPKEKIAETTNTFGLDQAIWKQIESESPAAATSFRRSVESLHRLSTSKVVLAEPINGRIRIQSRKMPSPLESFALLTGIAAVAGSVAGRRRKIQPQVIESVATDSLTTSKVESTPAAEPPTTTDLSL